MQTMFNLTASSAVRGFLDSAEYSRLSDRLTRHLVALRLARDEDDAADCLQEAARRAIEKESSCDPLRSVAAWFRAIAVNVARGRARRLSAHPIESLDRLIEDGRDFSSSTLEGAPDVDNEDLIRRLCDWAEELTDLQRTALEFRVFQGLTIRQIADLLDERESTIKDRLYSGIARLRARVLDQTRAPGAPGEPSSRWQR